jgi:hypothetical protein
MNPVRVSSDGGKGYESRMTLIKNFPRPGLEPGSHG